MKLLKLMDMFGWDSIELVSTETRRKPLGVLVSLLNAGSLMSLITKLLIGHMTAYFV